MKTKISPRRKSSNVVLKKRVRHESLVIYDSDGQECTIPIETITTHPLGTYRTMTTRITAADVADRLPTVHPGETMREAYVRLSAEHEENELEFCIVQGQAQVYGYLDMYHVDPEDETEPDDFADEVATPIPTSQILSADTPLLDLVPLFKQHYFYFLRSNNQLTGVVSYTHVDRAPFHLCLLAIVLELEAVLMALLTKDASSASKYVDLLKPKRLDDARTLAALKGYKDPDPTTTLECTYFVDKVHILLKGDLISSLNEIGGASHVKQLLYRAGEIRNEIAHGGSIFRLLPKPPDLASFTEQLQSLISAIVKEGGIGIE